MFIVLEGPDGSGKTTQIKNLKESLEFLGYKVVTTREPGGTDFAEEVRETIFRYDKIDAQTEVLLFNAARRHHIQNVIEPLTSGFDTIVICDRFLGSTYAYQLASLALHTGSIDNRRINTMANLILNAHRDFSYDLMPEHWVYLSITPEQAAQRFGKRGAEEDTKFEALGLRFQHLVCEFYSRFFNQIELEYSPKDSKVNLISCFDDQRAKSADEITNEIITSLNLEPKGRLS